MNLNELTGKLLSSERRHAVGTPGVSFEILLPGMDYTQSFKALREIIGNESRTRAVLSGIFWQVISSSESFRRFMNQAGVGNPIEEGGRLILTMHLDGNQRRYDLLVLSPRVQPEESRSVPLTQLLQTGEVTLKDIPEATSRWLDYRFHELNSLQKDDSFTADAFVGQEMLLKNLAESGSSMVEDLISHQEFSVMFAPMPATIPTNKVGSPAWGVALTRDAPAISTAGVATLDREGRFGVTASLHGVVAEPEAIYDMWNDRGAACVVGEKIYVGREEGVIRRADLITDSCFIEMDPSVLLNATATKGPLMNKSPYRKEPVTFDGLSSRKQSTFITEVDIGIPLVSRGEQAKVYTQPVTNPGDSGSALVNNDDYVLGFSHRRTGLGEAIEFAEWIWAHSVYTALQL
ncbi:MAG TPA: hypothetical protein VIF64_11310 [Pyrinomonadaceae bacterium]